MQKILGEVKDKVDEKLHGSADGATAHAPVDKQVSIVATGAHLTIGLKNDATSNVPIYAYITGQAIDSGNKLFLLRNDAKTAYFPNSPLKAQTVLGADCAIRLGAPGSTVNATIPHIAGGRIWFSYNKPLTFLVNPGPALVEPSVTNQSDLNYHTEWDFCEFTYNSAQLFANITYVDFVSIPIALTLIKGNGERKYISGTRADGLAVVANNLRAQERKDGRSWSRLIVNGTNNQPLRILSPNAAGVISGDIFHDYYKPYVDGVWNQYGGQDLSVNTQASYGNLRGRVQNNVLRFSDGSTFAKPSTADIFSCSTGPFAGGSPSKLALIPRVAAALNRSTLVQFNNQPDGGSQADFYKNAITNHYSRIVHEANVDRRGYTFPYDDVNDGTFESAGTVFDGAPKSFTVVVGGKNAGTTG